MTINKTAELIHANARSNGFFDTEKNIGEMLCLIHSEVSEALEADRNNHYASAMVNCDEEYVDEMQTTNDKMYFHQEFSACIKNTFEDELADVMIRVMDLASFKGIDLEYHIKMKMAYNSLREHKHSKKYLITER